MGIRMVSIYLFLWGFLCIIGYVAVGLGSALGDSGPLPGTSAEFSRFALVVLLLILCFWGIGIGMILMKKWAKVPAIILLLITVPIGIAGVIGIPLALISILGLIYLLRFKGEWR